MAGIVAHLMYMVCMCGVNSDYLVVGLEQSCLFFKYFPNAICKYSFVRIYPEVISVCLH
jgi:hypothetical protein